MKRGLSNWMALVMVVAMVMVISVGCASGSNNGTNNQEPEQKTGTVQNKAQDNKTEEVSNKEEQIELRFSWWGSQNRIERTMAAIKLFEEENPNIKIIGNPSGWQGHWQKLATEAAGGNLPDLINMSYAYLGEYTDRDLLVNLDPYVESGQLNLDNVSDNYLSGGMVNEELYAVNIGSGSFTNVYNPAMFEKAGVPIPKPGYTYEDFEKMLRALHGKLGEGVYATKTDNHFQGFVTYIRQHGAELYNKEKTGLGYDDDQIVVDFFTFWDRLLEDGISTPPSLEATVQTKEEELILKEKVAIFGTNSAGYVTMMSISDLPLKMTVYPELSGGVNGQYIEGQYISVSAHSKHPEEAVKFIDFMTNHLKANESLFAERGVPSSSVVRAHLYPLADEPTQASFDFLELVEDYSRPIDLVEPAGSAEVRALYGRIREGLNYDKLTPQEAAEQFRQEATEILAKNK